MLDYQAVLPAGDGGEDSRGRHRLQQRQLLRLHRPLGFGRDGSLICAKPTQAPSASSLCSAHAKIPREATAASGGGSWPGQRRRGRLWERGGSGRRRRGGGLLAALAKPTAHLFSRGWTDGCVQSSAVALDPFYNQSR
jgi:hypothetical protein